MYSFISCLNSVVLIVIVAAIILVILAMAVVISIADPCYTEEKINKLFFTAATMLIVLVALTSVFQWVGLLVFFAILFLIYLFIE